MSMEADRIAMGLASEVRARTERIAELEAVASRLTTQNLTLEAEVRRLRVAVSTFVTKWENVDRRPDFTALRSVLDP